MQKQKVESGVLGPVHKKLQSAYNKYNDPTRIKKELVTRDDVQPRYTNYTVSFQGALDHIVHNDKLEVVSLLELPRDEELMEEQALPSKKFPSDHLRIEAKFYLI